MHRNSHKSSFNLSYQNKRGFLNAQPFPFPKFHSWSMLDWLGLSSLKNSFKLHVTWSFKEEREPGNRYYPWTAHWDKFWNRCVSSYTCIKWSTTGMNIVRRQYSSGVPASTFPRRIRWLHLRGIEMLVPLNWESFSVNEMTFSLNSMSALTRMSFNSSLIRAISSYAVTTSWCAPWRRTLKIA